MARTERLGDTAGEAARSSAELIDELRLHVVPFTAGVSSGSRIFDGIPCVDFEVVSARHTPYVTHLTYRRP